MSPPHVVASASLLLLRRELEELYRLQAEQAARLAGLEGEMFLLKRQLHGSHNAAGAGRPLPSK